MADNDWFDDDKDNSKVLDSQTSQIDSGATSPEDERLALERERLRIEKERLEIERERETRERTGRTFTVLQVRREMDTAERARNRSAVMFGAMILGTVVVLHFNNVPSDKIIQEEINVLINNNSWEALFQYFVNLGVLPVSMVTAALLRLRNAIRRNREYQDARGRLQDLEQAALMNDDDLGLGGNGNANTR